MYMIHETDWVKEKKSRHFKSITLNTEGHRERSNPYFIPEINEHWRTFINIGLKGKRAILASILSCIDSAFTKSSNKIFLKQYTDRNLRKPKKKKKDKCTLWVRDHLGSPLWHIVSHKFLDYQGCRVWQYYPV